MSRRLFIGSVLESNEQNDAAKLRQIWEPSFAKEWSGCHLRWVRPNKLHITWLFFGSCNEVQEVEIRARISELVATFQKSNKTDSQYYLSYSRLEIFGSSLRPTALVLTPLAVPDGLTHLAGRIRQELSQLCEKPQEHEFRPHLTLLRFPRDYHREVRVPDELKDSPLLPLKQNISELSLIESHLGSKNDTYMSLTSFRLAAEI